MTLTPTTWPEPWHSRLRDCEGIAEIDITAALLQAQLPERLLIETASTFRWIDILGLSAKGEQA
jgi:hypothetical protein